MQQDSFVLLHSIYCLLVGQCHSSVLRIWSQLNDQLHASSGVLDFFLFLFYILRLQYTQAYRRIASFSTRPRSLKMDFIVWATVVFEIVMHKEIDIKIEELIWWKLYVAYSYRNLCIWREYGKSLVVSSLFLRIYKCKENNHIEKYPNKYS